MAERPNVLMIICDQLRADWLGYAGHPHVRTPNIDTLAARGTRFTNGFVATPVCMPNRASIMTGRMPSVHGLRYNGCTLPARVNTFVDVLRSGGYGTALIGKSHLEPFTGIRRVYDDGDEPVPIPEAWHDDDRDPTNEEPDRFEAEDDYRYPVPYYGFDHVDMVTDHGDRANGHYRQWFRRTVPNWRELFDPANELPHSYTCPQAYRTPIPANLYPTAYVADRASRYLEQAAGPGSGQPFFAFVSFPDPHHPFNPPGRYWDMYEPDAFEIPIRSGDHVSPPPPLSWCLRARDAGEEPSTPQSARAESDRHIREAMALSAGMITMIDDAVGQILATLRSTGLAEDTVVLFTSDHGDYLGDSHLLLKGAWSRDSINRIPLVWVDPDASGPEVRDDLVSSIDIAPTILHRVGIRPYHGMQGRSWMDSDSRDALLIEFNDPTARMGFSTPARVRTVRTRHHSLALYGDQDWGELFDDESDPNHLNNLWDSAGHAKVKTTLLEQLGHLLTAQMDESPRALRQA
ncbi:MAG: sulfatase-like hydrolase/transferase [Paracoccaceae bacterium]|nr:sulfatase-like hydrolase/transferase [Paracoccaceae bacterium]